MAPNGNREEGVVIGNSTIAEECKFYRKVFVLEEPEGIEVSTIDIANFYLLGF